MEAARHFPRKGVHKNRRDPVSKLRLAPAQPVNAVPPQEPVDSIAFAPDGQQNINLCYEALGDYFALTIFNFNVI
ncbi:transport system inner membrane component [Sphingopyxis macrogoltabida]|uniref:Transport system inner membrane component n=1 Tax=Sphingopyxis macrogoltabida TaxID=33050 RepID=A0AAC9FG01_SPHMC|nr:transport system inner membrane component [Sphingopyxis macrogoltabida]AMU90830.1 transport system inner membrane component [Sphingopyxis macrogoltabida]